MQKGTGFDFKSHNLRSNLKVLIINKSDSTGGAAVVSYRLMEALRQQGVDARMLVCEKLTDSPYVKVAGTPSVIKRKFFLERLQIFFANGFNRKTLFKIDTGSMGLPLWKHPWVKNADALIINWVNQGMLSLKGFKKLLKLKKPVIWTMHDMWGMTGLCHHAGECLLYKRECGSCPLLNSRKETSELTFKPDLSTKIWKRKNKIYTNKKLNKKLVFVAVSQWLKEKASESSLLKEMRVECIANAFRISNFTPRPDYKAGKTRILIGAARIDDPVKGLDTLRETSKVVKESFPDIAGNIEMAFFGNVKDKGSLKGFALPVVNLGVLKGDEEISKAYKDSDIVVSASSYETLPGTLVEAQAYGCVPVSFNRGGQTDIISHHSTGYLANYDNNMESRSENLARGIAWAYTIVKDPRKIKEMREKMKLNVEEKFSYPQIAGKYIEMIERTKKGSDGWHKGW